MLLFQRQILFGTLIKKENFSAFKIQRDYEHKFSDSSEDKIQYKLKTQVDIRCHQISLFHSLTEKIIDLCLISVHIHLSG